MRWTGHVACMGEKRYAYRVLVWNPDGKRHFRRLGAEGRIILKWIVKYCWRMWSGVLWLRTGTSGRLL
jgi:hypothetical protein